MTSLKKWLNWLRFRCWLINISTVRSQSCRVNIIGRLLHSLSAQISSSIGNDFVTFLRDFSCWKEDLFTFALNDFCPLFHAWMSFGMNLFQSNVYCKTTYLSKKDKWWQVFLELLIFLIYSRLSISRTRISRILRNSKRLSESKNILIAFSKHNLELETFLQVQITRSAN